MKILMIGLVLVLGSFSAMAQERGGCYYSCVTNVTNEYYEVGVSDNTHESGVAMASALASLQFDFSESALQVGVGVGTYRSESAASLGIAKSLGTSFLVNANVTQAGSHEAVGAGVTFKF
jgi:hypothetical protein